MFRDRNAACSQAEHHIRKFYPPPPAGGSIQWIIEAFDSAHHPARWRQHRDLAAQCYARRNLGAVSRNRNVISADFPTLVIEATREGVPIGGGQMHMANPLGTLPLEREMEPFIDRTAFQNFLRPLSTEGIVHVAGLWIAPGYNATDLAGDLGRAYVASAAAMNTRYSVGICHQFIFDAWRSLGFEPVLSFGTFAYPDVRYQTRLILGDAARRPADLADWASREAGRMHNFGQRTKFELHPMRARVRAESFSEAAG